MLMPAQTGLARRYLSERAVYRENRFRDGVTYELAVFAVEGGLYGVFTCPDCGQTEFSAALIPSPAEAIQQALLAVDSHHSANHAGS
jgi:hypothetical protein